MADRHPERGLAVRHQLGEQTDVLGPHDLRQHQGRDAGHDRCRDVGNGKIERAIDAHHDLGSALGDARHGGRQGRACGCLVRGQDRVLEVEDDGIGAARMGLRQETFGRHRHEQQRSPGWLEPGHLGHSHLNG